MVCGMSIELLLRTIIVVRGKEPQEHHHLGTLAAEAGVVYTVEQLGLLRILSEAIIWDGKYPVPLKEEHWENLASLECEHLFDKTPLGETGSDVLSGNGALDWDSYSFPAKHLGPTAKKRPGPDRPPSRAPTRAQDRAKYHLGERGEEEKPRRRSSKPDLHP